MTTTNLLEANMKKGDLFDFNGSTQESLANVASSKKDLQQIDEKSSD
jgi:hypothetical protein